MTYLIPYLPEAKTLFDIAPKLLPAAFTYYFIDMKSTGMHYRQKLVMQDWVATGRLQKADISEREITAIVKLKSKYGQEIAWETCLAVAWGRVRDAIIITRNTKLISMCDGENVHHMKTEMIKDIIELQENMK